MASVVGDLSVNSYPDGLRNEGVTSGLHLHGLGTGDLHRELPKDSEDSHLDGLGDRSDLVDLEQEAVACSQTRLAVRCASGWSLSGHRSAPACPLVSGTTSSPPSHPGQRGPQLIPPWGNSQQCVLEFTNRGLSPWGVAEGQ